MEQILYYDYPNSSTETNLLDLAVKNASLNRQIYFIVPSRLKMFQIRGALTERMGGFVSVWVDDFQGIERSLTPSISIISTNMVKELFKAALSQLKSDHYFYRVKEKEGFVSLLVATYFQWGRMGQSIKTDNSEAELSIEAYKCFLECIELYTELKLRMGVFDEIDRFQIALDAIPTLAKLYKDAIFLIDGYMNIDEMDLKILEKLLANEPSIEIHFHVPFLDDIQESPVVKAFIENLVAKLPELKIVMPSKAVSVSDATMRADQWYLNDSPCIEHEVLRVANQIRAYMKDNAYSHEDFCIVVPSLHIYEKMLMKVFGDLNIVLKLKSQQSVLELPVIKQTMMFWKIGVIEQVLNQEQKQFYEEQLQNLIEAFSREKKKYIEENLRHEIEVHSADKAATILKGFDDCATLLMERLRRVELMNSQIISQDTESMTLEAAEALISEIFHLIESVGTISKLRDQQGITVSEPDLIRGLHFKCVFLLGVNEGLFPRPQHMTTVFNEDEIGRLNSLAIPFRSTAYELNREKLRFKQILASAEQMVHLSYLTADEDGRLIIKSVFVEDLIETASERLKSEKEQPPVTMRERLRFNDNPPHQRTRELVAAWLVNSTPMEMKDMPLALSDFPYPLMAKKVEFLRAYSQYCTEYDGILKLDSSFSNAVGIHYSASSIEKYAKCPFLYLSEKCWKLSAFEDAQQIQMDIGSVYHRILQEYFQKVQNPMEYDEALLKGFIIKEFDTLNVSMIPLNLQWKYRQNLSEELVAFVRYETENYGLYKKIKGNYLIPKLFEYKFELKDPQGSQYVGYIDRIDFEMNDQGEYTGGYVIVDYKKSYIKGVKEFIEGSDHQLPIYYDGIQSTLKEFLGDITPVCLGLFYTSIKKCEKNGFVLKDHKKAFFPGAQGTKSVLSQRSMSILLEWAQRERQMLIQQIRSGRFPMPKYCPYSDSFSTACGMSAICRYELMRLVNKEDAYE